MSFAILRPLSLLVALVAPITSAVAQPKALIGHAAFDFGDVTSGSTIEHEYRVRNVGTTALHVRQVALTPPLRVTRMPAAIAPGEEAAIVVRMETKGIDGGFDGTVVVFLDDPAAPQASLTWSGRVVPAVEVQPMPALYLTGQRGERAEAAVTIVSHMSEPLRLRAPEHSTDRFESRLTTLEDGRRYRLTIALNPDGPGGKHVDEIVLESDSATVPFIRIPANTYLRERVYAFPDAVDLGNLKLADVRADPALLDRTAQTLMVYQKGGTDFRVRASTDVPGLDISAERGPAGDRYQLTLRLDPRREFVPGTIRGTIHIETSDARFPRLDVPVYGGIIGG